MGKGKFEIVEESRFLTVNEMGYTKGGVEQCENTHEYCALTAYHITPCVTGFVIYCGPANAVNYGCCNASELKMCKDIFFVEH